MSLFTHPTDPKFRNQYFGLGKNVKPIPVDNTDDDPKPIHIEYDDSGPFTIGDGQVICDKCKKVIRESYLEKHRSSGACSRYIQKKQLSTGTAGNTAT